MKIKDILEQEWKQDSPEFRTKHTDTDPITGRISWDVDYTPLTGADRAIQKVYDELKEALRKYPDDQRLEQLFNVYASFKKAFRTHINRKYGR